MQLRIHANTAWPARATERSAPATGGDMAPAAPCNTPSRPPTCITILSWLWSAASAGLRRTAESRRDFTRGTPSRFFRCDARPQRTPSFVHLEQIDRSGSAAYDHTSGDLTGCIAHACIEFDLSVRVDLRKTRKGGAATRRINRGWPRPPGRLHPATIDHLFSDGAYSAPPHGCIWIQPIGAFVVRCVDQDRGLRGAPRVIGRGLMERDDQPLVAQACSPDHIGHALQGRSVTEHVFLLLRLGGTAQVALVLVGYRTFDEVTGKKQRAAIRFDLERDVCSAFDVALECFSQKTHIPVLKVVLRREPGIITGACLCVLGGAA